MSTGNETNKASFDRVVAMARRLAAIKRLAAIDVGQALACTLHADKRDKRQFWCNKANAPFEVIDARIAERGGVVVARLSRRTDRVAYAAALRRHLKAPTSIDVISPPTSGHANSADGVRRQSVTHAIDGQPIHFLLEQQGTEERLVSISRVFSVPPPFPWTTLSLRCRLQSKPGAPDYRLNINRDGSIDVQKDILLKRPSRRLAKVQLGLERAFKLSRIWARIPAQTLKQPPSHIGGYCSITLSGPNKRIEIAALPSDRVFAKLNELFVFIRQLHASETALSKITPVLPGDRYRSQW